MKWMERGIVLLIMLLMRLRHCFDSVVDGLRHCLLDTMVDELRHCFDSVVYRLRHCFGGGWCVEALRR